MTSRVGNWLSSPWGRVPWSSLVRGWMGFRQQDGQDDSMPQASGRCLETQGRSKARAVQDLRFGLRKLHRQATLRLTPDARGLALRGVSGSLCITQAGDPEDYLLGSGQEFRTGRRGVVVVWALTDGAVVVDPLLGQSGIVAPV